MPRVLVVGANGFIGGHIARGCADRGGEVWGLVRSRTRCASDARLAGVRLFEGSAQDPPQELAGAARSAPLDAVIYAAGVWRFGDRRDTAVIERLCTEVYVGGVERLAKLALEHGAHLVFMSGISRFGNIDMNTPVREDSPPHRFGVYGRYKRLAEERLANFGERGLRWTALCPPDVYGVGDPGSHVRFVIERSLKRRFFVIGDGQNLWSLCHVDNVVAAALHFMSGPGRGAVNIADAAPYSQLELSAAVRRALGRRGQAPRVPRALALALAAVNQRLPRPPGFPEPLTPSHVRMRTRTLLLDTSRAREFGFAPAAQLADGVASSVAFLTGKTRG